MLFRKSIPFAFPILLLGFVLLSGFAIGQGSWIPVAAPSPDYNNGVMLLLSDGSVMVKSCRGGLDTLGNRWNKLTHKNHLRRRRTGPRGLGEIQRAIAIRFLAREWQRVG